MATFGFNRSAEATLDVFRPVFEDRIISRRANVVWPPRSCTIGHTVGLLFVGCSLCKPETIDALKDNFLEAIGEI